MFTAHAKQFRCLSRNLLPCHDLTKAAPRVKEAPPTLSGDLVASALQAGPFLPQTQAQRLDGERAAVFGAGARLVHASAAPTRSQNARWYIMS